MRRRVMLLTAGMLLFAMTASLGVQGGEFTGTWLGSCLMSKVEAHVDQDGEHIMGVCYVTASNGERSPYHFTGIVKDGVIEAKHHSGHVFTGKLLENGEIAGTVVTAKSKHRLALTARRKP